ncbi:hypothetical protein MMC14_002650 [Varicellaria rhodocarpa]|nr:hypothetical protein [Varicellaria rhodocarpa]
MASLTNSFTSSITSETVYDHRQPSDVTSKRYHHHPINGEVTENNPIGFARLRDWAFREGHSLMKNSTEDRPCSSSMLPPRRIGNDRKIAKYYTTDRYIFNLSALNSECAG